METSVLEYTRDGNLSLLANLFTITFQTLCLDLLPYKCLIERKVITYFLLLLSVDQLSGRMGSTGESLTRFP